MARGIASFGPEAAWYICKLSPKAYAGNSDGRDPYSQEETPVGCSRQNFRSLAEAS
jgi:hypothetical protein